MNSAHIITRYEPRAITIEQPDGTLLISDDLEADLRYFIALFTGFVMVAFMCGALWAAMRHMGDFVG